MLAFVLAVALVLCLVCIVALVGMREDRQERERLTAALLAATQRSVVMEAYSGKPSEKIVEVMG